jgi:Ion channel
VAQAGSLPVTVRRRRRLTWLEALILVAAVTASVLAAATVLVQRTDPERFPDAGTGLWWAATTVTTVGYGDVVPASGAGRAVGVALMFVGIASFAFLTAVAASAIVVGEVSEQEREIEREEGLILLQLRELSERLDRLEAALRSSPRSDVPGYTDGSHDDRVTGGAEGPALAEALGRVREASTTTGGLVLVLDGPQVVGVLTEADLDRGAWLRSLRGSAESVTAG